MQRLLHVTSTRNRESITRYGLDWSLMGAAPGIAGSPVPEVEGTFLCRDESECDWFVRMNNTGGPVDVWAVDGVDEVDLVDSSTGFCYLPARIPPSRVTLVRREARSRMPETHHRDSSTAYQSSITITFDDGRVLRDAEVDDLIRKRRRD